MEFSDRRGGRGRSREPGPPLGFLIPSGFVTSVAACAAAASVLPQGTARVVAMAAAVTAFAGWARSLVAASATAAMAWFFATGFLVNTAGELTFGPPDLVRVGAFAVAGLAGSAVAALRGLAQTRPAAYRPGARPPGPRMTPRLARTRTPVGPP